MARLTTPCTYNITHVKKYCKHYFEIYFDVSKEKELAVSKTGSFSFGSATDVANLNEYFSKYVLCICIISIT